jgi:signal transduction histidine kinase
MCGLVSQLYLSAAQSTQLCLAGGMDESVIYSFSIMGLNLGEQEQFALAFRYEDLARDLCAKYPNTFGATRGMNGIVWCNMHSRSHPATIVDYCLKAIQCGKNCGDLYNAGLSYGPLMWNLQVQGKNLHRIEEFAEECLQFSHKNQLFFSVGLAEAVLAGWVAPMKADYKPVDMQDTLARWAKNNYVAASGSYFVLLGISQYYRGDYAAAVVSLNAVEDYLHGLTDNVLKRLWFVFKVLNHLRLMPHGAWKKYRLEIIPLLGKIETWASLGVLLKPYLAFIYAEIAYYQNRPRTARTRYLDAINIAQNQDYTLLTGHLYECLGDLMSETTQAKSELYYDEAQRLYKLCHAEAKNLRLQERYQGKQSDTIKPFVVKKTDPHNILPNLDINYLMKSALALSAETDLDRLLQKIMTVVLECSGAQHGYLLIKEQNELVVAAENHIGKQPILKPRHYSISKARGICPSIVNYVSRTHEKTVLNDACATCTLQCLLPELKEHSLRSVLCLPVVKQQQLIGVLYLENRLSVGIFTSEKTGMTELLTSHAAISIENARLLEETRHAYDQLQESREHMMQMEKLSALGTLVGGVAHEINNPLMGVMNYVEFAQEKTADAKVAKVLGQALHEIGRIKSIVRNMLIYVRTKSNPSDICQISEAINQTLALLEGELKKTNVHVHLDLPEPTPAIKFSADSLQQVLINLLLNARDALTGVAEPRIDISVKVNNKLLELSICDNGSGIPEAILTRIFDPFFTTKPPGKGTGLGLSVSHRLIEEAGGRITVYNKSGCGCCMALQFKIAD